MKFASCLIVFSLLFLEPSTAQCTTICGPMETCEAEGKQCDACDGTADCALVTDTGYCTGCSCPTGCNGPSDNGTTCSEGNPAAGGAESCDECHWQTNACVVDPAYCDGECLTCEEACAACEAEGCVYTETVGDGRECVCALDCEVCDPTCTDEICHPNPAETACMCVPDCASQQDNCGTAGHNCASALDTCELNDDHDDCECSQGPPPPTGCAPADCTGCTGDEICELDGSSACACVLECDLGVNDTACGGGCTDPALTCDDDLDMTGCMCVPDCGAGGTNCGSGGYDCESVSDTCELTSDKTDCECSQGPPPTTTEASPTTEDSTAGAVANAGVIGAFLVVMLLSLAAA